MTGGETSNGRITLAILSVKLDSILENQKRFIDCQEDHTKRIVGLELGQIQRQTQIQQIQDEVKETSAELEKHEDEIHRIDIKASWWNGINSALVAVAGILGFIK